MRGLPAHPLSPWPSPLSNGPRPWPLPMRSWSLPSRSPLPGPKPPWPLPPALCPSLPSRAPDTHGQEIHSAPLPHGTPQTGVAPKAGHRACGTVIESSAPRGEFRNQLHPRRPPRLRGANGQKSQLSAVGLVVRPPPPFPRRHGRPPTTYSSRPLSEICESRLRWHPGSNMGGGATTGVRWRRG